MELLCFRFHFGAALFRPSPSRVVAALWPIKDHPDREIVAKVFKVVLYPGGRKQQVLWTTSLPPLIANKLTAAPRDYVNLVPRVWRLRIMAARRVKLHYK